MYLLQEAEAECQIILSSSRFEKEVLDQLDQLLTEIGVNLDLDLKAIIENLPEAGTSTEAIKFIQKKHDFKPDLFLPQYQADPIHRMIPKRSRLSILETADLAVDHDRSRSSSLKNLEERMISAIEPEFAQLNRDQFRGNFNYFLRIDRRPQALEKMEGKGLKAKSGWVSDKIQGFDLLADNLYHTKSLLQTLAKYPSANFPGAVNPNHTWLRIVALVSLYYGCLAEPGFFVSVTDRLLRNVATFYGTMPLCFV
jgi:hypothetical protein